MKVELKKKRIKQAAIFTTLVLIFAAVFYFWNPFPTNEWTYKGQKFSFRENIKEANNVPVSPNCQAIFNSFNNPYINNLTIYFKNDPQDFDLFRVEVIELSYKITAYSIIGTKSLQFDKISVASAQWNLTDYPKGSPAHPRIYLIGPTSATENSVKMENFSITVQGRNLKELDLATIKTMMCIFGIKV